ncbi:protein LURP-one-related 15-like [Mercurialis annua]|uniref:protein LURP-one-related 15-like n=1 Tax=Mercurialis annua TaxID=3986 RepID=UPI00215EA063|nr:protein LURP-one-related 15-like [Mercurialis annua]
MAAQASNQSNTVAIISPKYCSPSSVELGIVRKFMSLCEGDFDVLDINGNIIFTAKEKVLAFLHEKKFILDPAGKPILTLRKKAMTAHSRWQVFRGESEELKDLIFTVKKHSLLDLKLQVDVFLANNRDEQICDFKIKCSLFEHSCVIYTGEDSSTIIAEMHKKPSAKSILLGKTNFMVTVNPNVDHVFVVALIVVLDEILFVRY